MHDASLGSVVVIAVELVVTQALGCTVGGRRYRAASGRAADQFGREVVDRYLTGSDTLAAVLSLATAAQIMQ